MRDGALGFGTSDFQFRHTEQEFGTNPSEVDPFERRHSDLSLNVVPPKVLEFWPIVARLRFDISRPAHVSLPLA